LWVSSRKFGKTATFLTIFDIAKVSLEADLPQSTVVHGFAIAAAAPREAAATLRGDSGAGQRARIMDYGKRPHPQRRMEMINGDWPPIARYRRNVEWPRMDFVAVL
jgi:hypothetical protein